MNYRNIKDLNNVILQNLSIIPRDFANRAPLQGNLSCSIHRYPAVKTFLNEALKT